MRESQYDGKTEYGILYGEMNRLKYLDSGGQTHHLRTYPSIIWSIDIVGSEVYVSPERDETNQILYSLFQDSPIDLDVREDVSINHVISFKGRPNGLLIGGTYQTLIDEASREIVSRDELKSHEINHIESFMIGKNGEHYVQVHDIDSNHRIMGLDLNEGRLGDEIIDFKHLVENTSRTAYIGYQDNCPQFVTTVFQDRLAVNRDPIRGTKHDNPFYRRLAIQEQGKDRLTLLASGKRLPLYQFKLVRENGECVAESRMEILSELKGRGGLAIVPSQKIKMKLDDLCCH